MNIVINYKKSDAYVKNIAFIRALLIKCTIEDLSSIQEERNQIFQLVLQYLKDN